MMKTLKASLLSVALTPLFAQAIGIDGMIKFTENGRTDFTISSNASYREFIQVGITELTVKNGELVKLPYSRDNISDWTLMVRPARTVIEPKLSKLFQVENLPSATGALDKDQAYLLSFIPTPYFAEGEPVTHSVKVAMGFAPVVIVPAKEDKPIHYTMSYGDDGLMLNNEGDTYLRAVLDACPEETTGNAREACSQVVYALSGRHLPIKLSDAMKQAPEINVELSTHNSVYKASFTLKPNQVVASKDQ